MTVDPQSPAAVDYSSSTTLKPKSARPMSVSVLAIIGIVLGGLFTLCSPMSLIVYFIPMPVPNPIIDSIKSDPLLMSWNIINAIWMLLLSLLLLVSSIGSLSLRPWARRGMKLFGSLGTTLVIAGQVAGYIWITPRMKEVFAAANVPQVGLMALPPVVTVLLNLLITLPYPILVWYFFTRPHVVAAFEEAEVTSI